MTIFTLRRGDLALAALAMFVTALYPKQTSAELLTSINANTSYTRFDLTGQTQEASHASFSLEFPGSGIALQSDLVPFAGPFPIRPVFDASDLGFAEMAALLTDDEDEILKKGLILWLPNGQPQAPGASAAPALESILIPSRPILLDARVTSIELAIGHMNHEVSGTNERLAINARWLIHGVPVPEPGAMKIIVFGVGGTMVWRRRSR